MSTETMDLEALFDQVAEQSGAWATAAKPVATPPVAEKLPAQAATSQEEAQGDVHHRIGALTRNLHEALRELGYNKTVEQAVNSLPDARDRLAYIATLTGKAAERALAAVEAGRVHQDALEAEAKRLGAVWDQAFDGTLSLDEFKANAVATRAFLKDVPTKTGDTNAQLTEIMMAQDFHDLTGQVIQRIVRVAQDLEVQLANLLIETTPAEKRPATEEGWLTGPAVNGASRPDVVTSQAQVDDLLESLGF
jgi:chemotaxis protein CheZ